MSRSFSFTSESVSEGHPDKVADQISDAVLDAILAADPKGRVACETLVKTGVVIVAGEVTTSAWVDVEALVRKTVLDIGYDTSDMGFDGASCGVLNIIGKQSPDIAQGVDRKDERKQGRRRSGIDVRLCHQRNRRADARAHHAGAPPGEAPGAGAQERQAAVAAARRQEPGDPALRGRQAGGARSRGPVDAARGRISTKQLREAVMEEIFKPVLPANGSTSTPSTTSIPPGDS